MLVREVKETQEPFIKIYKERESKDSWELGNFVGYGVIQGLSVQLPEVIAYSVSFEDNLVSHDWKRKIAQIRSVSGLSAKEAQSKATEQFAKLGQLFSQNPGIKVPVKILVDIKENENGTLDEQFEENELFSLTRNKETGEPVLVIP